MRIALVGAGNLATNLGDALVAANHEVLQVYSRTWESAETLASRLHCMAVTSVEELVLDADLYIVALKDSVLEEILPRLVQGREQALWVHTAGSVSMSIWENRGVKHYGVFYPLQTFSKSRNVDFSKIPIFLEANLPSDLYRLKGLAASITDKICEADSKQRASLHLAAVFACNFTNAMYVISEQLLKEQGLSFDALLPLVNETAAKVHALSPLEAQTGPAVRYDLGVINKHLAMLESHALYRDVYEQLSRCIHYEQTNIKKDDKL